jgi:phosphoserine phosphatase
MRRLFLFDVDSTLINEEVIDLIAAKAGVLEQVSQITTAAMSGNLDFSESLIKRVALLSGVSTTVLNEVQSEITLTNGAVDLIKTLLGKGDVVAVVSGGFTEVIAPLLTSLKIKDFKANSLQIIDGRLTGKVQGPIIDRRAKAEFLREIAAIHQIPLAHTVAVGDGANDIDMIQNAGVGIAFCAKPALVEVADRVIVNRDLMEVLKVV